MGYRSQVVFACTQDLYEKILYDLDDEDYYEDIVTNTIGKEDQRLVVFDWTKWYKGNPLVDTINKYIRENKGLKIIIYGKNCNDDSIHKKYQQLLSLGFYNVYAYNGGMFEWLMLQDIYGAELFPCTKLEKDILKFKPHSMLNIVLLEN